MNRLHKLQKRARRVLCEAKYNAPTHDLFNSQHVNISRVPRYLIQLSEIHSVDLQLGVVSFLQT